MARGVVLLVVAVVIGAFFLARGNSGSLLGNQGRAGAAVSTTTTPTSNPPPATPTTTKPAGAVKIAVYNGTGGKVSTAAGNSRTTLVSAGYTKANISVNDYTSQLPTSVVYYEPTVNQADAGAVAAALGFPTATVQSATTAEPNVIPSSAKGVDIVVLIGLDAQTNPAITGSSTTSTGSTTTTSGTSTTTSTTG